MADDAPVTLASQAGGQAPMRGEHRWPMAVAAVVAIVLTILLPNGVRPGPRWVLALAGLLLVGVIVADPGRINRRTRLERLFSLALLIVLIVTTLTATVLLIHQLIKGGNEVTKSGSELLLVGNSVLVINVIVFALLHWEGDSGGSAARGLPATVGSWAAHKNPTSPGPGGVPTRIPQTKRHSTARLLTWPC